jgi:hypothetical protein
MRYDLSELYKAQNLMGVSLQMMDSCRIGRRSFLEYLVSTSKRGLTGLRGQESVPTGTANCLAWSRSGG